MRRRSQGITDHHNEEHTRLTDEAEAGRTNFEELYASDRAKTDAKFKEAHWTILTLNDSDKRPKTPKPQNPKISCNE